MVDGQRSGHQEPACASAGPVAVVGIGCRFPGGAGSPDDFWELLRQGKNTTSEIPEERWQWYRDLGPEYTAALRKAIKYGSFLTGIENFDGEFFGVTPREAEFMDPQQRILLEVAWEALEHAGIPARDLAVSDTGVFMGVCTHDYGRRLMEDLPNIEAWTGIGAATCCIANRISYALDLRGPSVSIDTACSASLVAVHLACQSLRLGESGLALVGGVNLVISPSETLTLGEAGALAPDGRSKSFDASADGYGRGEGCGVLVLKRLADAQRDGDRVLAVIRGTGVSQDGHTNGIMAPCGEAQTYVMSQACANGGIDPATVDYIEAHGTGTRLGDPQETEGLSKVYGSAREPGSPTLIGSVKANIGHLEGAAGVAGVIKAVLALQHASIPANPLVTELNPNIAWEDLNLRVVTEETGWPRNGHARRAGVSGFGYGGTIAHVVLEEAPEPAGQDCPPDPAETPRVYPLSSNSAAGLPAQAKRLASWLSSRAGTAVPLSSVGHTLALRRSHLDYRATVVAAGRDELASKLRQLAKDEPDDQLSTGSPLPDPGTGLVWVFSGHGSQWIGMGRELLNTEPVFTAVIREIEPIYLEEIGFSPYTALMEGDFETVDRIQTLIFAMQVGLAEVWRSAGLTPDAVIGHSVGELAAAVTAGALSRADGARLICRRSKLLRRVAGRGAMAMVSLGFDDVAQRLGDRDDIVPAISAAPHSTVVAGDPAAIEALIADWTEDGLGVRRVASDVAFHSPQMEPLLTDLAAAAAELTVTAPRIPVYTTALPDPRHPVVHNGDYWAANLRNPVRLAAAVSAAAQDGYRVFLEVSAHPVVAHSVAETLAEEGIDGVLVATSLRRNKPEVATLLNSAGELHCHGVAVSWPQLQPAGGLAALPTSAWQRRRHWRDRPPAKIGGGAQHDPDSFTLLGAPTTVAGSPVRVWHSWLDDSNRPYPGSHALNGVEIVPATVLVNSFYAAVSGDGPPPALADLSMQRPLMTGEGRTVQVVLDGAVARLASRSAGSNDDAAPAWLTHATARVVPNPPALPDTLPAGHPSLQRVDKGLVHQRLAQVGVPETGFSWVVEHLMRGDGALRGKVRMNQPVTNPSWAPVLDAIMSLAPVSYPGDPVLRMVVQSDTIVVSGRAPDVAIIDIGVREDDDTAVDVLVAGTDGRVVARLDGLRYAIIGQEQAAAGDPRSLVYQTTWRPFELPGADSQDGHDHDLVIVTQGPASAAATTLGEALTGAGVPCRVVTGPVDAQSAGSATDIVFVAPAAEPGEPAWSAAATAATRLAGTARQLSGSGGKRLWCVTAGAADTPGEASLAQSALWAVGRVIAGEHEELWGGIVDLDPSDPAAGAPKLLELIRSAPGEDVIAVRDGAATVARLSRLSGEPNPVPGCRADATYLVTGGLGRTGLQAASWLASRGARRLVLADQRAVPPRGQWDDAVGEATRQQIDAIRALEAEGATVVVRTLDVTDPAAVRALRDPDALGLPPIAGVVHAAGGAGQQPVTGLGEDGLRVAMQTRAAGASVLHEVFPPATLDFLVLFSSSGHVLSEPGQAGRGAVAAFLDALATSRATVPGDHTLSIGWVPQASAADVPACWELAAEHGAPCAVILTPGPAGSEQAGTVPLLRDVAEQDRQDAETAEPEGSDSLSGLSPEELQAHLVEHVGTQIATEMRLPLADLDPRRSLVEQGLDSVMTMMVRRRLEKRFGRSLPATLLWQKPTVASIAEYLTELLVESAAASPEQEERDVPLVVG